MSFLVLRWIHILSAVLLLGAGVGSAFILWRANRERNIHAIRFALKYAILADWLFTLPPIVLLPVTGYLMMRISDIPFSQPWVWISLVLFVFAGMCWLPAAVLQYWMTLTADQAEDTSRLPERYWRYERLWLYLGVAAFPAVIAILTLMIFKPV
ncbi:MAG: DUF2269 family protein [Nitrospinaceae bacterium]|nr:DUF2269 domain-containing protein [Nitrospinaceae bacterium]NIR55295.1 DUF2269 domain-containing protein [Nitrospinaceae bacterium]NIS85734.1 DUF2269 domain-containing protein [Nitrospinaceae bacterium]NIT82584.1 DUF2269 domain-containing protein [Nitrospinaceae bacterium]NIU44789.1 DUF2269 domain-containing protein [Nitrospinaceae bacterium]